MRILKFGGKSLSLAEKTQKICKNIQKIYKNEKELVIVVSAIGSTTDNLTSLANTYGYSSSSKNELAKLLSTGETVSASLFAIMLQSMGLPAKSFSAYDLNISTFGDPLNSKIAYINKKPILDAFKTNTVCVVAGFQGISKNNEITLLGRGGSDTTAAALGAVFDTSVEIYSDFAGVFSGDPRLLNYKKLKCANYSVLLNMAKAGAKVLDSRAISIAQKYNIDIISKSSTHPNLSGSKISNIESDVVSISQISNLCEICVCFSNSEKLNFIVKNVLFILNDIKFYNFSIEIDKIKILINETDKLKVLSILSKKLNLLKK